MKRLRRMIAGGSLFGLMLVFSVGCEQLQSEKRMLKRQVVLYQVTLSKGEFKEAHAKFHAKDFVWISRKGTYKGANPSRAFLRSIEKCPERSDVYVDQKSIEKLTNGKYVVKADFRVRGHTASSVTTTKWTASMTWVRKGDKWRCIEHKELTDRSHKRT